MALIEWRDEFSLGIASVDQEHREMVDLINEVHARVTAGAPRLSIEEFLGEIYAKISSHFALEEKIMREQRYDQYDEHKADHERLLDEIRDIMDDHEAHQHYDDDVLSGQLETWFTAHFKTKDARLHKFLGH